MSIRRKSTEPTFLEYVGGITLIFILFFLLYIGSALIYDTIKTEGYKDGYRQGLMDNRWEFKNDRPLYKHEQIP